MRIFHISNDYYYSSIYRVFLQELNKRNINSMMFVPIRKNGNKQYEEENVIQAHCFNKFDKYFFLLKQNKIYKVLKREVENTKPDILHAHFLFSAGYLAMKVKRVENIPYVVAVRNTDLNLFFKWMILLRPLGVKIMLNASKIIFISSSYRDKVLSTYVPNKYRNQIEKKSLVLPNGIDDFWHINNARKPSLETWRSIKIITVGAINKNKNQLTVAKAIEGLIEKGYKATYTVVGKVEDLNVFNQLKNYSFVNYIENVPKERLIYFYREADIFVMPSINETFGLVYAEAMTQGLPVIYSRGQGFDQQFNDGEIGFAVESLNENDVSDKIIEIIETYDILSKRCTNSSIKFSWESIIENYIRVYEELTSE